MPPATTPNDPAALYLNAKPFRALRTRALAQADADRCNAAVSAAVKDGRLTEEAAQPMRVTLGAVPAGMAFEPLHDDEDPDTGKRVPPRDGPSRERWAERPYSRSETPPDGFRARDASSPTTSTEARR